jgi:hypothetical protein
MTYRTLTDSVQVSQNILDNAGFEIWQRGTSFTLSTASTNTYTADRWEAVVGSGAPSIVVSQNSSTVDTGQYSMEVAVTTLGGFTSMIQKVENYQAYYGKTVSCSIRVN